MPPKGKTTSKPAEPKKEIAGRVPLTRDELSSEAQKRYDKIMREVRRNQGK
jgi:hypothetical protein